ncbi:MAG: beta-lactamase family protein [Alphaproteobacteria bacterium]|nr:beta-lactamase family protein [Alphaproteobacteria bacterium]
MQGQVSPGWEAVKEVFAEHFDQGDELGAAVAVIWRGEEVVSLWGGWAHQARTRPWAEDTLSPVYSATKGVSAMVLAHAHARGLFDYDAPVARYWPEFVAHGKEGVTVRQLLAHQAGLATLDENFPVEKLSDHAFVDAILARQAPDWTPGTRHGYHATTIGLYEDALLRRVDPQGRDLGQYLAEELAGPLGAEFYIGLPDDVPDVRVAEMVPAGLGASLRGLGGYPREVRRAVFDADSLLRGALVVPEGWDVNDRAFVRQVQGSSSGVGSAVGLARLYGAFATGEAGLDRDTFSQLAAPAEPPLEGNEDQVLFTESWYSLGFSKPGPKLAFGGSRMAFGTPGAGGSRGFADPLHALGYAYIPNKMGTGLGWDPRDDALQEAVYRCLARLER